MHYVIINTRQKICRTKFSPGDEIGKNSCYKVPHIYIEKKCFRDINGAFKIFNRYKCSRGFCSIVLHCFMDDHQLRNGGLVIKR